MIVYRNKSCICLDWIELKIQLNQFEMFVSSLLHERDIEKCTVLEEKSVKINHVNKESKS